MPNAPRTLGSLTPKHARPREYRGTAQQRGYDYRWSKLRNWWIRKHPLCQDCMDEGITNNEQLEVDHVIPFMGKDDPLRLDTTNLRTRCKRHHRIKTLRDG